MSCYWGLNFVDLGIKNKMENINNMIVEFVLVEVFIW